MGEPVRILQVIGIMNRGGAENMIMNLYRQMDRERVQFDFVENSLERAAFDDEIETLGGRIYRCPHYNGKNHFTYVQWWKDFFRAHAGEYPVVHGHIGSTAAIYLAIAKEHGAYTVAHSHSAGEGSCLYRLFSYPTRNIADHFFACSRDAGTSRYGAAVGNDEKRCQVLPNAIDTEKFVFDAGKHRAMRAQLGIGEDTLVVGHVGRFVEAKNHDFLLDVFSEIHRRVEDSVLLLVGDGELRPQIEEKIRQLGLENAVIMTGVQSNVYDYDQTMDVFVMPSLYEGLPVTMVETQTAGLTCFISDAIPEETALTELVHFLPLSASAAQWAEEICRGVPYGRPDMQAAIREKGYDIRQTARWLQEFYENVAVNHGK